jgi:hypothetical protein
MTIVLACDLSVEAYAGAGRTLEVPRPDCQTCLVSMIFWSGYWRSVRDGDGLCWSIWAPRVRCPRCEKSHGMLPAFVLSGRLDVIETIGRALEDVVDEGRPVMQAAAAANNIPRTTVREWVRRFSTRVEELAVKKARNSLLRWRERHSPVTLPGCYRRTFKTTRPREPAALIGDRLGCTSA